MNRERIGTRKPIEERDHFDQGLDVTWRRTNQNRISVFIRGHPNRLGEIERDGFATASHNIEPSNLLLDSRGDGIAIRATSRIDYLIDQVHDRGGTRSLQGHHPKLRRSEFRTGFRVDRFENSEDRFLVDRIRNHQHRVATAEGRNLDRLDHQTRR